MLKIHTSDGKTLSFDLCDEVQGKAWTEMCADEKFQESITGVALLHNRTLHTLPLPKKFKQRRFTAEVISAPERETNQTLGERVTCQADNIRVSITAYYTRTPKMVRFDVARTGWQRYNNASVRRSP